MNTAQQSKNVEAGLQGGETVVHPATGLEWSPMLGERVTWEQAKKVAADCRAGGHEDWRLPTIEELISLIDFSRFNPAANTELFPDMKPNFYWSSTPDASSPSDYAWLVSFYGGYVHWGLRVNEAFVRAVRGSRASQ